MQYNLLGDLFVCVIQFPIHTASPDAAFQFMVSMLVTQDKNDYGKYFLDKR